MRPAVTAGMGVSQHLVLAAALALSMSGLSLGLPQNYDDIDMSIDQPKNEKVDIRFVICEEVWVDYILFIGLLVGVGYTIFDHVSK